MPRRSQKQILQDQLFQMWQLRVLFKSTRDVAGNPSLIEDSTDLAYLVLHQELIQSRYIQRSMYCTRLSVSLFHQDLQPSDEEIGFRSFLNPVEFLQKYRMSRENFSKLLSLIESHTVFDHLNLGPKQAPAAFQLLIFLKYVGTEGGGSSNPDLRNMFRTGQGTNNLFKARIIKAIRSLQPTFYTWPDVDERKEIRERIHSNFGLPYCIGFADGTLNPLATKPQHQDSADFYGRKNGYSLSTLIVCDDRRLIRYFLAGWAGSCHDNRIFHNSLLATAPENYFSNIEYLLGDSAFEAADFMVPAYKKPNGCTLPREHEVFNTVLSSARVISKHAIGIWKARFLWLRHVRMLLTEDKRSMQKILDVLECTVILHNFLIIQDEPEVPDEWLDNDDVLQLDPDDELNRSIHVDAPRNTRQRQIMTYVNDTRH